MRLSLSARSAESLITLDWSFAVYIVMFKVLFIVLLTVMLSASVVLSRLVTNVSFTV